MRRQRKPTFAAMDICRALGIPHGTLNSWGHHGWFRGLDAEKTTPGRARQFTLEDLFRLALTKALVELGLPAARSQPFALFAVNAINQHAGAHITEVSLFTYPDGSEEMRFNEELMTTPVTPGAVSRVTIFPAEIVRAMKARLGVE